MEDKCCVLKCCRDVCRMNLISDPLASSPLWCLFSPLTWAWGRRCGSTVMVHLPSPETYLCNDILSVENWLKAYFSLNRTWLYLSVFTLKGNWDKSPSSPTHTQLLASSVDGSHVFGYSCVTDFWFSCQVFKSSPLYLDCHWLCQAECWTYSQKFLVSWFRLLILCVQLDLLLQLSMSILYARG